MERIEAVDAAGKRLTAFAFEAGAHLEFIALQTVAAVVIAELPGGGIEFRDALIRAHPQIAVLICPDATNHVIRQAVLLAIMRRRYGGVIEFIEAGGSGANPKRAATVEVNRYDLICTQTLMIIRIMAVTGELFRGRIAAIQAAAPGADPQHAGTIFVVRQNMIVSETVRILRIMLEMFETVAIVLVQAALSAEPYESLARLPNAAHQALRQVLVN